MKAPIARSHKTGWIGGLQAFIMRGNVMDRAAGIVIGAALTAIVNSLVKDLFTPLSGLVLGGLDFSNWFVMPKGTASRHRTQQKARAVTLNAGLFLNAVISPLDRQLCDPLGREGAHPLRAPTRPKLQPCYRRRNKP